MLLDNELEYEDPPASSKGISNAYNATMAVYQTYLAIFAALQLSHPRGSLVLLNVQITDFMPSDQLQSNISLYGASTTFL